MFKVKATIHSEAFELETDETPGPIVMDLFRLWVNTHGAAGEVANALDALAQQIDTNAAALEQAVTASTPTQE